MTQAEASFRGAVHPKFPIPLFYVFIAFAQAAFTSGIIFGWPALQLVFTRVGAFSHHCKPNETMRPCPEQTMYFNTIYTCGIFANNISTFFTGWFLDHFGPKWTNFAGFVVFMAGCLPFIFQIEEIYVVGYSMLGFSGPGIYVSIMHLSNLFPGRSSFILSLFSGTFAISSLVFKSFEILYQPHSWFDVPHLFIALEIVLAPLMLIGLVVWPRLAFAPAIETESLLGPQQSFQRKTRLYNTSLKVQLLSLEFWFPSIWIALQALHIHSYIGSVNTIFINDESYISAFNYIWLGGITAIPFFGVMIDSYGTTLSFFVSTVMFMLFSVCSLIPVMQVQYVTFALVSITNVGVWGVLYSYLFNVFGVKNYGKILGTTFACIAAIGLLQYPILSVTINNLDYDFRYANGFFAVISLILFAEPIFLWTVDRKKKAITNLRSINSAESASASSDTESVNSNTTADG